MAETDLAPELLRLVRSPDNPCFVCGQHNPGGLHVEFHRSGGLIFAEWTPDERHQGWQGVVHGGILVSLLDEAMAYTLFTQDTMAMTARMEVRYRSPGRAGDLLKVEACCVKDTRKIANIDGRISASGRTIAEASARFVKVGDFDPRSVFRSVQ